MHLGGTRGQQRKSYNAQRKAGRNEQAHFVTTRSPEFQREACIINIKMNIYIYNINISYINES